VYTLGRKVESRLGPTLRFRIAEQKIKARWTKELIRIRIWEMIDWEANGKAIRSVRQRRRRWVVNHSQVSAAWPCDRIGKWDDDRTTECPCCVAADEITTFFDARTHEPTNSGKSLWRNSHSGWIRTTRHRLHPQRVGTTTSNLYSSHETNPTTQTELVSRPCTLVAHR